MFLFFVFLFCVPGFAVLFGGVEGGEVFFAVLLLEALDGLFGVFELFLAGADEGDALFVVFEGVFEGDVAAFEVGYQAVELLQAVFKGVGRVGHGFSSSSCMRLS